MSRREANFEEAGAIADLLARHADWAMFPLGNLLSYGMGRDGRLQMRFFVHGARGEIAAAVGLSALGMILPVLPDGLPVSGPRVFRSLARAPKGETVQGVIGRSDRARPLIAALDLPADAVLQDGDEPAFALELDRLRLPSDDACRLQRPGAAERPLPIDWREAYGIEILAREAAEAMFFLSRPVRIGS
ncbi:MAG: hypothetical protein H6895_13760 [Defluviimonas sp.]|uniref:hypothetical protein n=1 Tax=Albidovulum sp. TaxID=1872424 RepID=UPI001DBA5828|nr:hypothetical protein [Paracoccaceae bacterium]MCC0065129.1 hypothetical protein [Defluviimonas sp.]